MSFRFAALFLLASVPAAQSGGSGSATGFFNGKNAPSAAGSSSSAAFGAETELGHATGGAVASSPNFQFQGSVLWAADPPITSAPVVFGVQGGFGDKDGGVTESVFGYNLSNGGAPAVDFESLAGQSPMVASNLELTVDTPPGVDGDGNPLPLADVTVTHSFGTGRAADAYAYLPALLGGDPPRSGKVFRVNHIAEPGTFVIFMLGQSLGVTLPLPPIEGAFDLLQKVFYYSNPLDVTTGFRTLPLYVPDDPALVGFTLELQALSLDFSAFPNTSGAFTNRLSAVIQD